MHLSIDTSAMKFLCAAEPEPVLDFETKTPKTDEHGQPLTSVRLVVISQSGADVITVKLPGTPTVSVGEQVSVSALVAIPWTMGDRNGIAFRATKIESVATAKSRSDGGSRG